MDLAAAVRIVKDASPEARIVADGVAYAPHLPVDVAASEVDWWAHPRMAAAESALLRAPAALCDNITISPYRRLSLGRRRNIHRVQIVNSILTCNVTIQVVNNGLAHGRVVAVVAEARVKQCCNCGCPWTSVGPCPM